MVQIAGQNVIGCLIIGTDGVRYYERAPSTTAIFRMVESDKEIWLPVVDCPEAFEIPKY